MYFCVYGSPCNSICPVDKSSINTSFLIIGTGIGLLNIFFIAKRMQKTENKENK